MTYPLSLETSGDWKQQSKCTTPKKCLHMNYTLNGTFPSFILMRPIFDGKKKKKNTYYKCQLKVTGKICQIKNKKHLAVPGKSLLTCCSSWHLKVVTEIEASP